MLGDCKCRICENTKDNKVLQVAERILHSGKKFEYLECGRCGCVILNEIIRDYNRWYPAEYNPWKQKRFARKKETNKMAEKSNLQGDADQAIFYIKRKYK